MRVEIASTAALSIDDSLKQIERQIEGVRKIGIYFNQMEHTLIKQRHFEKWFASVIQLNTVLFA